MVYLPKSSYTIKQSTRVGELLYIDNRSPYIGNYIETRDGKYYAGVSPTKLGIELVKPEKSATKAALEPVKKLNRLDLPTFGLPTIAIKDDIS